MTDIVEKLYAHRDALLIDLADSLKREDALSQQLAECQAQTKQAKREALLTAADVLSALWGQSVEDIVGDLRRMADGMK